MPQSLQELLQNVIDQEVPLLRALEPALKTTGEWSQKEELGHLIDSATNNHLRFVRAAIEGEFRGPAYAQNEWVRVHGYEEHDGQELVEFWYRYNTLLADLAGRIPEDRLAALCYLSEQEGVTLDFLIRDYVAHPRHHVDHVLRKPAITQYPPVGRLTVTPVP